MNRFDLNLLSALDALLSERNVTRAAERLNVTQSTMSGMLLRLRGQFEDPLLVRDGRRMELTPFASSLVSAVQEALRGIERLMQSEPVFDPTVSTREFRLMVSDYCISVFLPQVVARVAEAAPGVRIVTRPLNFPVKHLLAGDIDLCMTAGDLRLFGYDNLDGKMQSEELFTDEFVCIVAADHPLQQAPTLEDLFSYPHVGIEVDGALGTIDTVALKQQMPLYKPSLVISDFSLVPCIVANSHLVGMVQARLAKAASRTFKIRSLTPPFEVPVLQETMIWHSRHRDDPGHLWFRGVLRTVGEQLRLAKEDPAGAVGGGPAPADPVS